MFLLASVVPFLLSFLKLSRCFLRKVAYVVANANDSVEEEKKVESEGRGPKRQVNKCPTMSKTVVLPLKLPYLLASWKDAVNGTMYNQFERED